MKALPVIIVALLVIGVGNLMNNTTAQPVALPDKQAATAPADCDGCDQNGCTITVEIPLTPTYVAAVGASDYGSCRRPVAKGVKKAGKAAGKIARVPIRAVKRIGKVVVRAPARIVRAVGRAKPVRRVLGRIFGRRRR